MTMTMSVVFDTMTMIMTMTMSVVFNKMTDYDYDYECSV